MDVCWTRRAKRRLQQIGHYIAQDNPRAALKTVQRIWDSGNKLASHPGIGRDGRVAGTRELVVQANYIVIYRVRKNVVEIVTVQHAASLDFHGPEFP